MEPDPTCGFRPSPVARRQLVDAAAGGRALLGKAGEAARDADAEPGRAAGAATADAIAKPGTLPLSSPLPAGAASASGEPRGYVSTAKSSPKGDTPCEHTRGAERSSSVSISKYN